MRSRSLMILSAAMLLLALPALADHYSDFYVLPVASHTPGQNGTMWMSDVAIQNFQSTAITVEAVVIESGITNLDNVSAILNAQLPSGSASIPAGGSVLLKDILNGHRGMTAVTGAILLGADRPFAVTSRTYSMAPSGDTVGQTVPPSKYFLDNTINRTDLATAVAYLPGLIDNARFRTNIGMVAANASGSTDPLDIVITLRGGDGTVLGTRSITLPAGGLTHVQFSTRSLANNTFEIGSADVRITSGSGAVVPYASVVDNVTADAVFILGELPRSTTTMSSAGQRSALRDAFNRAKLLSR